MDPAGSRPVNKAYLRDLSPEDCWSRLGETGIGLGLSRILLAWGFERRAGQSDLGRVVETGPFDLRAGELWPHRVRRFHRLRR